MNNTLSESEYLKAVEEYRKEAFNFIQSTIAALCDNGLRPEDKEKAAMLFSKTVNKHIRTISDDTRQLAEFIELHPDATMIEYTVDSTDGDLICLNTVQGVYLGMPLICTDTMDVGKVVGIFGNAVNINPITPTFDFETGSKFIYPVHSGNYAFSILKTIFDEANTLIYHFAKNGFDLLFNGSMKNEIWNVLFERVNQDARMIQQETNREQLPPGFVKKECEHCGKKFSTDNKTKRYCPDNNGKCRSAAKQKRHRAKKALDEINEIRGSIKNYR